MTKVTRIVPPAGAQGRPVHLFRGVLPRRGMAILTGNPKTGKSLFALRLAICLAAELPVFATSQQQLEKFGDDFASAEHRGATLYVTAEDRDEALARIDAAASFVPEHVRADWPEGQPPIIPVSPPVGERMPVGDGAEFDLGGEDEEGSIAHTIAMLELWGFPVRLLVFDTATSIFDVRDENNNMQMQALADYIRLLADRFDALALVTKHPKKAGRRETGASRGAGSFDASADTILSLTGERGSRRRVKVAKLRSGACTGEEFVFDINSLGETAAIVPVAPATGRGNRRRKAAQLTDVQRAALAALEGGVKDIAHATTTSAGKATYGATLEALVKTEFAAKHSYDTHGVDGFDATKVKDVIRRRIGRDGLRKLVGYGIVEEYTHNGSPAFRPAVPWEEMPAFIAATFSATSQEEAEPG